MDARNTLGQFSQVFAALVILEISFHVVGDPGLSSFQRRQRLMRHDDGDAAVADLFLHVGHFHSLFRPGEPVAFEHEDVRKTAVVSAALQECYETRPKHIGAADRVVEEDALISRKLL